jgi:hypothetical protein
MLKRLALGLTFAMLSTSTLLAVTLPSAASDAIPCSLLPSVAADVLAALFGVCG